MPLSIESEIDLLYHLSTMSEHVLPKGMFYLLLWKRLNQSGHPPAFTFDEMIEHLRVLYDESVFDNPELPSSHDHDFQWEPIKIDPPIPSVVPVSTPPLPEPANEKEATEKIETTPVLTKTRKRASSPSSNSTAPSTPTTESGRRSSRQRNPTVKEDDDQLVQASPHPASKTDKRKSVKEPSRTSTRVAANQDSIGTRLRAQK